MNKEKALKNKLIKEADKLWHQAGIEKWGLICFFEGTGLEAKAHQKITNTCHHFKPKGLYPELRYSIDNAVPCCWPCHYKMEKVDKSMAGYIVAERGKKWLDSLKGEIKTQTVAYYEEVIKNLQEM